MLAAIAKRAYGNDNTFNKVMKKWLLHPCEVEGKPDEFYVGDRVVYDGCGHAQAPECYPAAGTTGRIVRIGNIKDAFVQWAANSTSGDDRWWTELSHLKHIK